MKKMTSALYELGLHTSKSTV